jgi:tRNA1(Val) A37 N6-methylase TrmN6
LGTIVDIGSGNGQKLVPLANQFKIVAVDIGPNLRKVAEAVPSATRIEFDLERGLPPLSEGMLAIRS